MIKITYQGVEYKSMKALSRALDLPNYAMFYRAILRGDGVDEAVKAGMIEPNKKRSAVNYGDLSFPTLKKACSALGVNYMRVQKYIKKGATWDEAIARGVETEDWVRASEIAGLPVNMLQEGYVVEGVRYYTAKAASTAYCGKPRERIGGQEWRRLTNGSGLRDDAYKALAKRSLLKRLAAYKKSKRNKVKRTFGPRPSAPYCILYTRIVFCRCCSKAFSMPRTKGDSGWLTKKKASFGICSDDCRKQLARQSKKKNGSRGKDSMRARHRRHGGTYTYGITPKKLALRDGMRCQVCGDRVERHKGKGWQPKGWSIGHVIAIANGGDTTWENVQCECSSCNSKKGATDQGQLHLFGKV